MGIFNRRKVREHNFHQRIYYGKLNPGEMRITNNSGRTIYLGGGRDTGWPIADRETLWVDTNNNDGNWARRVGDLPLAEGVKLEIGR